MVCAKEVAEGAKSSASLGDLTTRLAPLHGVKGLLEVIDQAVGGFEAGREAHGVRVYIENRPAFLGQVTSSFGFLSVQVMAKP